MKISAVVATYNGERYVEEQLRSIAAQTRAPDEIVVADDGSTDDTVVIVERVCHEEGLPLRLERSNAQLGATANFARAIAAATGDTIVLCDQDDRWCADKLARVEAAFASDPNATGVFSDGWLIDASGARTGRRLWSAFGFEPSSAVSHDLGLLRTLLRRPAATGATMAFSSSVRDLVLPMERRGLHDVWISVLLAATGGLRPLSEPLIEYRLHGANAVGLGEQQAGRAIRARQLGGQRDELAQYEALVTRLRDVAPQRASSIELLEEKVAHLRLRCNLPRSPVRRALRIGRSLSSYARYSSGWRSPILDLVAPTPGAAPA